MRPFAKPLVQLPLFFSSLFYCGACWKARYKTLDDWIGLGLGKGGEGIDTFGKPLHEV